MKTLDEVIELNENILTFAYLPKDDTTTTAGLSLFYLREYREIKNHLACMNNAEIRGDSTQIINNPPLTWEELKLMEGKPVWVEEKYSFSDEWYGRWEVIDSVWYDELKGKSYLYMTDDECQYKDTYGTLWKAYRKKRK